MKDTGWRRTQKQAESHAVLYENKETPLAAYQLITYPDGGLITSSRSLALFLQELIAGDNGKGKLLSKENYAQLFEAQLDASHYEERNESTYNDEYNFGVFMGLSAKGKIGHTGGDPGVVTLMFFDAETGIGKLIITNTDIKKEAVQDFIQLWQILEKFEGGLSG